MYVRRIGSLRYPYHSQLLLTGTIQRHNVSTAKVCHKTLYDANHSCDPPLNPYHELSDRTGNRRSLKIMVYQHTL